MIKQYFLSLALATVVLSSSAQERPTNDVFLFSYFKGNGEDGLHLAFSHDGYVWEALRQDSSFLSPTAGKDRLMRDPCIIRGEDGLFHMVWTVSWNERGIGYASSPDLLEWSPQKFIPVMDHEPTTRNCWAPEIFYDKRRSHYVIYWASTIPGRFPQQDSSAENGYNHRMYYTTTRDFQSFTKARLLFDPGFSVIDAVIVQEGRQYVMVFKDERRGPLQKNLRIAYSRKPTEGYSRPGEPITEHWVEGPTVIKSPDHWMIYYDRYTQHSMGAIISADLKTWTDVSGELHFPTGVRHGTIFQVSLAMFEKLR